MAIREILLGENLGGIAQDIGTSVDELLKLNPTITDRDVIQAGASLNIPEPTAPIADSPAIVGSDLAREQFADQVGRVEEEIEGLEEVKPIKEGEQAPLVSISSTNVALRNLGNLANSLITQFQERGGTITPELQQAIDRVSNFEATKTSALAEAKAASDIKDPEALADATQKKEEAEKSERESINDLIADLKATRETFIAGLVPTERETELRRELRTLRTERQLLPLELRKEGISAAGIASRQVGDERVRAIQEGNLLFELGLEQEAREFRTKSIDIQLGFIRDDINLQSKIESQIRKDEQDVIDRARDLSRESLNVLNDILEGDAFGGLAFEDLEGSQADLLKLIEPFPDLTPDLLSRAMKNAKQREILDKATGKAKPVIEGKVIGGIEVSNPTLNVIEGVQSLSELTPSARTQANTELRQLGFFSSTPPDWFRQIAEQEAKQSISPEELNRLWEKERQLIIKTTDTKDSVSTRTP